ncbi:MAG: WYL domain-containing protein [Terriglobia bacterium]
MGRDAGVKDSLFRVAGTSIRRCTWHPGKKIDIEPAGSIILTLKVADLGEVKFWLIGFGVEATVLSPIELAKVFRRFETRTHDTSGKERG